MSEHERGATAPANGVESGPAATPGERPQQGPGYGQPQASGQESGPGQPPDWTPYQGQAPWYPPPPWPVDPRLAHYPPFTGAPAPQGYGHPGYGPGTAAGYGQGQGQGQGARVSELVEEIAGGGSGLSSLGKMLDLDDVDFWKGALVGAAAVLLLTNDSVQSALFGHRAASKDRHGPEEPA